ncbi:glycosyltransferase, group 1 family protein [delta proteobacterium NaphS2]|nr:glycosyltransferase, group 1 family protein [delta proteobacterium NaphS2]
MKILQLSTYDIRGGAARATYRLHLGLRNKGQDSRMLVRYKNTDDDSVSEVCPEQNTDATFFLEVPVQEHYINAHRTELSNTLFSLPYPGYDVSHSALVQDADIINLHWVSRFQSPVTLKHIFALGKPVVWTLHDQWAFTGGCHYSSGCEKYRSNCIECPQLTQDSFSLTEAVLHDKEELFRNANLTIVAPSRWMGRCARESRLFKSLRIEVIANSLETDIYCPVSKKQAKERLDIPQDVVTFLFGAVDGTEKRKGFVELVAAIKLCRQNSVFQELLRKDKLRLLCFGNPNEQLERIGIPFVSLGKLKTDKDIRDAYSAADIFLLPSLEDNLPNTILESLSCGTPVVAFDVGGIPDMVTDGVNGLLINAFDIPKMGEAIVSLSLDSHKRAAMGKAGRERATMDYALEVQAKNYLGLYEDLLNQNQSSKVDEKKRQCSTLRTEDNFAISCSATGASLNTTLGSRFGAVYDDMLFVTLKSYAPHIHKQWNLSELDRAKRLEQVNELTRLLEDCEADRTARSEQLNICEADRAKRLEQVNRLAPLLEDCEADRKARLEQLNICEADRKARLDLINSLTDKLNDKKTIKQLHQSLSEIEGLKQQFHRETQRALVAEQGWEALENTQVVRKARKMGLIKLEKPDFLKKSNSRKL